MPVPTWRTTAVGIIVLVFVGVRAWVKPESLLDPTTFGLVGAACALIAGTDKLFGR